MKEIFSYENPKIKTGLTRNNGEPFRQLIRNSFDMIVLLDREGRQLYVSESCERILGYPPEELVNIPVIDTMIHPEDQSKVRKGFNDIIDHTANGGTQYRHRHKNGDWVYLEAFGSNQLDNPLVESIILNVRDITDRKKTEQALKQSEARLRELNATKDRFFSIIGHDLRTPFSGILGLSDLLLDEVREGRYEELEEYATLLQQSTRKAFELFTNLLDWSRAHTGSIHFSPEKIDLTDIVLKVLELFDHSVRQKSITLTREVPDSVPVSADKAMVQTILRNLLSNAIKFTEPGGIITVGIEKGEEEHRVTISDNGVGIDPETMEHLFSIEHAHSTPGTLNETGTGLGLLLCKEFVEQHHGRIWAEAAEDGTRFVFTLPPSQGLPPGDDRRQAP